MAVFDAVPAFPSYADRYRAAAARAFMSKAALRRATVIEASLKVQLPCTWVSALTDRHGAVVNIVEQKPIGNGLLQSFVEVDPKGADPAAIEATLRADPFIEDAQTILQPRGRLLATLQVRECHACQILADSECFLTDATAAGGRGLEWNVLAPERDAVKRLVDALKGRGLDVEITSIRSVKSAGVLTSRQEAVLSLAYKLGYFEYPKKINLTRLATKLDVAKSTLSEILRAGEAKILHSYFHGPARKGRGSREP